MGNRQVSVWAKGDAQVSIWVHRPLNLAAMDAALHHGGVNNLELDTHVTSDGVAVVWHYERVDGFTDGHGSVEAMTLDEIRRLRIRRPAIIAGQPFTGDDPIWLGHPVDPGDPVDPMHRIPTLSEVFTRFPDIVCSIDMKTYNAVAPTIVVMKEHERDFDIGASFHDSAVQAMRSAFPQLRTAAPRLEAARFYLASRVSRGPARRHPKFSVFMPPLRLCLGVRTDKRLLGYARTNNLPVHIWTANSPKDIRHMLDFAERGLLAGFQTDHPMAVRHILETDGWKQSMTDYTAIFGTAR